MTHFKSRFPLVPVLTLGALLVAGSAHSQDRTPLLGFGPASSAAQLETEAELATGISSTNLEEWMEAHDARAFFRRGTVEL